MKKVLALGLSAALILALGATALAAPSAGWMPSDGARVEQPIADDVAVTLPDDVAVEDADGSVTEGGTELVVFPDPDNAPEMVDVPLSKTFGGVITVDGKELDLSGVPGAPGGYLPMRAICEATGAYVEWFPEDNQSLFVVDEHSVLVGLNDLSITCDFELVEGYTAYLDPNGYTFLPVGFLTTFENFKVNDNLQLSSVRYDITTVAERSGVEALAYAIMETAQTGKLMELDAQILEENYSFHMDAYAELVAYQPMMTAQPTTIVIAQVKEGQMDTAKADIQAYLEAVKGTLGFYPACAEALEKAQTVESADGTHLMLVCTWENNDDAVKLFNEAFPAK